MFPDYFNPNPPRKLFIDFNCFFPRIEQQANAFFRGRPVGITNRTSPNPSLIAISSEAKALGVKMPIHARDAKTICPDIVILESDVDKYLYAHKILGQIFRHYSDKWYFKSVDEGCIDMTNVIDKRSMQEIAETIKREIAYALGIWVTVSIGIANSQWMGKLGSELQKPDGLVTIDHTNFRKVYKNLRLTDLPYIAGGNSAKLMVAGIYNVDDFYKASIDQLTHAFKSIHGLYWYYRLRGYEIDEDEHGHHSVTKMFRLKKPTYEDTELMPIIQHQCHALSEKLRLLGAQGGGVFVYMTFQQGQTFYARRMYKTYVHRPNDIYKRILALFNQRQPAGGIIVQLNIACYHLTFHHNFDQLELFRDVNKEIRIYDAVNIINDRYGKFTAIYADALGGKEQISQKIPMGSSEYVEMLNS